MSAFGVHSKYLRTRNERKAASVLDVRCVVAFFRSKVVVAWRKLVVFIVYDGRAVELILDCHPSRYTASVVALSREVAQRGKLGVL